MIESAKPAYRTCVHRASEWHGPLVCSFGTVPAVAAAMAIFLRLIQTTTTDVGNTSERATPASVVDSFDYSLFSCLAKHFCFDARLIVSSFESRSLPLSRAGLEFQAVVARHRYLCSLGTRKSNISSWGAGWLHRLVETLETQANE